MPTRKTFTIICYDITLTRRRTKVADLLEQYGIRRNKSVFECMLTKAQTTMVRKKISEMIDTKTDTILFYRVCLSCYVQSETIGKNTGSANGFDRTVIV
jgi:CRISPR-associated protein Cas2